MLKLVKRLVMDNTKVLILPQQSMLTVQQRHIVEQSHVAAY